MNTERTPFYDQSAAQDDMAIAEATWEAPQSVQSAAKEVKIVDHNPETIIDKPNKLKRFLGGTAIVLASLGLGHLFLNAVDHQITHDQQVNNEYVNMNKQSQEVNSDTVVQIPAPTK